jgi:ABC-type multidrug transport system fused ATPase/permease subunit
MRTSTKLAIILLLFPVLLATVAIANGQSSAISSAQDATNKAYTAILDASNAGANTTQLITQLNQAINLTSQAQASINTNPEQAQALATQAQAIAQNVTAYASAAKQSNEQVMSAVTIAVSAAALIVGGCLVYFFGPKFFWKTWLKLRKNYRVKTINPPSKTKNLAITWEQVCGAILAATVIIALVATVPLFLPKNTSGQISELGILGPNMQLGDYPKQVVSGQIINLYGYVGNQMGKPMYYDLMVKLGDNKTAVDPASTAPMEQFTSVVASNGTWTFPFNVTLTQPGVNQRIIFELWMYNQTLNQMQYHHRWGQIWLNVTAPAS